MRKRKTWSYLLLCWLFALFTGGCDESAALGGSPAAPDAGGPDAGAWEGAAVPLAAAGLAIAAGVDAAAPDADELPGAERAAGEAAASLAPCPAPYDSPPGFSFVRNERGACVARLDDDAEVLRSFRRIYAGAARYLRRDRLDEVGRPIPYALPAMQYMTPIEGSCCAVLGGPDVGGNGTCDSVDGYRGYWNSPTWRDLDFAIVGEHRFLYTFESPAGHEEGDGDGIGSVLGHDGADDGAPADAVIIAGVDPDCRSWFHRFALPVRRAPRSPWALPVPRAIHYFLAWPFHAGFGEVELTAAQREAFAAELDRVDPHEKEKAQLHRHLDEIVARLADHYRAGAPHDCSFPGQQGVTPVEGTCCPSLGGPSWGAGCTDTASYWEHSLFAAIGFAVRDEPFHHVYEFGPVPDSPDGLFAVRAHGDFDCDSDRSTVSRFLRPVEGPDGCDVEVVPGYHASAADE